MSFPLAEARVLVDLNTVGQCSGTLLYYIKPVRFLWSGIVQVFLES